MREAHYVHRNNQRSDQRSDQRSKLKCQHVILAIALAALATVAVSAQARPRSGDRMSLSEYLGQVTERHQGYRSAEQSARAARLQVGEGSLLYKPVLTGDFSASAYATNSPFDSGHDFTKTQNYNLGISEQTPFGLSGRLALVQGNVESPTLGGYHTNFGKFEVSLSLFRNLFGSEVRSQADAIESAAQAKAAGQSFQTKTLLFEAESNYWRLVLSREMVDMQRDAVERAQKLHEWSSRRVSLQLTDRAETYATSTNLQARRLDLRTAQDDERAAMQTLNSSRGVLSENVPEKLAELGPDLVARLNPPERSQRREDLRASEFQAKAAAASARASREKYKPTLEVFASGPFSDPGTPRNPNLPNFLPAANQPTTVVGVKLSAPLDVFTTSKLREGYNAEAQAADWNHQRKVLEEERDWVNLSAKFRETKERLRLFTELERTQRQKLDHERERQQRGRSTLQQVLIFENDYATAQLGRLRTFAELLTMNAQMKLYGATYESR